MKKSLFFLGLFCVVISSPLAAATIPAGTMIVARTTGVISSHARAHGHFDATVDHAVKADGKVALPVGTHLIGVIEASRGNPHRSSPLTLNLTNVVVNGKKVPLKTTGSFRPEAPAKTARQSRAGFTVGETFYQAGTRLEFRLAQPLNL